MKYFIPGNRSKGLDRALTMQKVLQFHNSPNFYCNSFTVQWEG